MLMHRRMFSYALDVIEKTLKQAWKFEETEELLMLRSSCWQNMGEHPENDEILELHNKATNVTLMGLNITTGNAQNGGFGVLGRNGYSAIYNVAGGLEIDYNLTTDLSKPPVLCGS